MKRFVTYLIPSVLLLPIAVSAATFDSSGQIGTFFEGMTSFIDDTLIPILLALSFLLFIVGLVQFFLIGGEDNSEAKKKGKGLMLWGIIAFVVIVSIWGIVKLISGGLGLQSETLDNVPDTPSQLND